MDDMPAISVTRIFVRDKAQSLRPAVTHQAMIDNDSRHPSRECGLAPEQGQMGIRLAERVLNFVFRVGGISQDDGRHTYAAVSRSRNQLLKGGPISILRQIYEIMFSHSRQLRGCVPLRKRHTDSPGRKFARIKGAFWKPPV